MTASLSPGERAGVRAEFAGGNMTEEREGTKAENATAPPHDPGGITENSPAFQCWDQASAPSSPVGTAEPGTGDVEADALIQQIAELGRFLEGRSK